MTMTVPEKDAVPGVAIHLTRRDAARLDNMLEMFENALHTAFTNGVEIPCVGNLLFTASAVSSVREVIERNSSTAQVTAEHDSSYPPVSPGGSVIPGKVYIVRHEIGQLNLLTLVPRWMWSTENETRMTIAQFRSFDIPPERRDAMFVTRSRIHLLDENGKILRERFGYK